MATGHALSLFEIFFDAPTVTEIKGQAVCTGSFFPGAAIVLDIGGQDRKAISMVDNGRVKKF